MPQFTALNGQEYKKVILDKIAEELENSGLCAANLTYPWIKWSFVFKHTSYPHSPMEQEPQPVVKIEEVVPVGELPPLDIIDPGTLRVLIEPDEPIIIDTPDQARVDSGQPIPTPVPLVGIGIVDKLIMQAKASTPKTKTHGK